MRFGYIESRAEFQKHLLRILELLIYQDEISLMNNILILIKTVDENL